LHFAIYMQHSSQKLFHCNDQYCHLPKYWPFLSGRSYFPLTLWKVLWLDPSSLLPLSFITRTRIVLLCLPAMPLHALTRFLVCPSNMHLLAPFLSLTFTMENSERRVAWRSRVFFSRCRPYSTLGKIARLIPWHLTIPYDIYAIIERKCPAMPLEGNSSVENTTFHFLHIALTTFFKFLQLALIKLPTFYS